MDKHNAVIYSVENQVAVISHNRPQRMNASSSELRAGLRVALQAAESDPAVRVVVLTGEGRAFGSGADLKDGYSSEHKTVTSHILKDHKPLIDLIRSSKKPYIAAVNGAVAGISIAYAMACDMMIMAESAYLYSSFAAIGLIPDGGTCWFLMQRLGRQRAYQAIVESVRLSAVECFDLGIANKLVSDEQLRSKAVEWAATLAADCAPLSLRYTKEVLNYIEDHGYQLAAKKEAQLQHYCSTSSDRNEGVSAFLQKRKPEFTGE